MWKVSIKFLQPPAVASACHRPFSRLIFHDFFSFSSRTLSGVSMHISIRVKFAWKSSIVILWIENNWHKVTIFVTTFLTIRSSKLWCLLVNWELKRQRERNQTKGLIWIEEQWLCTCVIHLYSFRSRPLQNDNVKLSNSAYLIFCISFRFGIDLWHYIFRLWWYLHQLAINSETVFKLFILIYSSQFLV